MTHVPLNSIGRLRSAFLDDALYEEQRAELGALEARLEERRAEVQAGWGEKYVERVHDKGKLTARERVE